MSYSVLQFKSDLSGALHGTSTNKVQGLDDIMNRAAGKLLLDIDPIETVRIEEISNALYDSVYDYILPSDLKGNKIIDIRPQVLRGAEDNLAHRFPKEFDIYKSNNTFAVKNDSGVKSVRISKSLTAGVLVNDCESLTANGTWAASGGASGLKVDTLYYLTGSASLNFDLDGATAGVLACTDFTDVDLSDYDEVGAIFVWVYMPVAVTSVTLRWGNSATVYWEDAVTSNHDSTSFQVGWNLLRFDWNGAAETGTVDPAAIDYLRLSVVYTGTADTDFRVDSIYCKLPEIYEIEYYSKYLFRSSAGAWAETVLSDSDYINLDRESYELFFDQVMILIAPQVQGADATFDLAFYKEEYKNGVKKYKSDNPSQAIRVQSIYYQLPFKGRR